MRRLLRVAVVVPALIFSSHFLMMWGKAVSKWMESVRLREG